MTDKKEQDELIRELNTRIMVCRGIVSYLENDLTYDPRQPEALNYYKSQLDGLETRLRHVKAGLAPNKPAPIVIGLKSATLTGKVPDLGEQNG